MKTFRKWISSTDENSRFMVEKNKGNVVYESFIFLDETADTILFQPNELLKLKLKSLPYNFDNTVIEFNQIMSKYRFIAKASISGGSQKRTRRKLPRKTTTKKKPTKNPGKIPVTKLITKLISNLEKHLGKHLERKKIQKQSKKEHS